MKFLEKCGFDVLPSGGVISGVILSTIVLIITVGVPPSFYITHLIVCFGGYALGGILASVMYNLVYFVYRKIKR
jgi:hypothetical protein